LKQKMATRAAKSNTKAKGRESYLVWGLRATASLFRRDNAAKLNA
jgi:hypothetical protein